MVTILEHRIENTHIRKNCLDELELNREPVHVVGECLNDSYWNLEATVKFYTREFNCKKVVRNCDEFIQIYITSSFLYYVLRLAF